MKIIISSDRKHIGCVVVFPLNLYYPVSICTPTTANNDDNDYEIEQIVIIFFHKSPMNERANDGRLTGKVSVTSRRTWASYFVWLGFPPCRQSPRYSGSGGGINETEPLARFHPLLHFICLPMVAFP